MKKLEFVKKLYNGKNCYSDHMGEEELQLLHIASRVEDIIKDMLKKGKIVFLTGNPGDGKTFIIKVIQKYIEENDIYVQTDLNNVRDYSGIVSDIVSLYNENKGAIIAVNEYPFIQFCNEMRVKSQSLYDEIHKAKKEVVTYGISHPLTGRVAIVDLNERNLLGSDCNILEDLIDNLIGLLNEDAENNSNLRYNLDAMSNSFVKHQLLSLFQLAASECIHFAIRDILGALSFIFTACTTEEYLNKRYYSSIFEGSNELLRAVQKFDPIYLSVPSIDERLWNGEIVDGWLFERPSKYPKDYEIVNDALEYFKDIKRRYYFENKSGVDLMALQPEEVAKSTEIFNCFEAQKKKIKESLIRSLNKLFLPTSDDKKQLHIWTTHKYDMSLDATIAVSSKSIDASDLDILMPRPADWLKGLEYIPNHILMKPKKADEPKIIMDVDFLRTLSIIEDGYPIGLLESQYEQAAAMFIHKLDDYGLSEINDEGEIIIASRKKSFKKVIRIQNGKYDFEEVC